MTWKKSLTTNHMDDRLGNAIVRANLATITAGGVTIGVAEYVSWVNRDASLK